MLNRFGKLVIVILAICSYYTGWSRPMQYERKSVAFINEMVYIGSTKPMSNVSEKCYLTEISNALEMERFDYNPIPEPVIAEFRKRTSKRDLSLDEIENILDQTVVKEIISILDVKKEMRARELVTETQKNSFIALKARQSGVTAEQLQKVMNSSFLYLPYIEKFKTSRVKDDVEDELKLNLSGGLIWYHISGGDDPGLKKVANISSHVSLSKEKEGSWRDTETKAVCSAASTMGINLKTKTRELDMFKLLAPIADVQGRKIKFPLGENEGIKLDQPYYVGEWRRTENGNTKFYKDGFARIGYVAGEESDQNYMSSAWGVKKGDWARGMVVMEHPRLGIDLSIKSRMIPVNIDSGLFIGEEDDDNIAAIFDSYTGYVPAFDLDLQGNLAHATGIRQSFLTIGLTGAVIPARSKIFYEDSKFKASIGEFTIFEIIEQKEQINNFGLYFGGHLGYLKKYYIGPWALHWEAKAAVQAFSVTADYEDKASLTNITFGGRVNLGLEYALSIDTNIGVFAGFNAFPAVNSWIVRRDDDSIPVMNDLDNYNWPRISSIGKTFGLYFHYSIPSIPFNPGGALGNAM